MNLVEILKSQTQELKESYVEQSIEYAKKEFDVIVERVDWKEEDWANFLGVETRVANEGSNTEFVTFYRGFYNSSESRKYYRLRDEANRVYRMGKEEYLNRVEKKAVDHYENSILKLANRIQKKGLNEESLHVETARVGVNLETTLTDGEKTVRAWTIVAWGDVQRPHYRYLIK